nr:DNA (cytosine-5)-methyltransferase 1-like [Ipomoea trifida]
MLKSRSPGLSRLVRTSSSTFDADDEASVEGAFTVVQDCNVVLRDVMMANGDAQDCIPSTEASSSASKVDDDVLTHLPKPGDFDFIVAGPPWYKKNSLSDEKRTMILSFLSYIDYFRSKYVLVENIRKFVSFDNMKPFQLTLKSFLEMGYQGELKWLHAIKTDKVPDVLNKDILGPKSLIKKQLNHLGAFTVVQDCNVVLRDVMMANGDAQDCIPSTEASSSASKVDDDVLTHLPKPRDLDFIVAGPSWFPMSFSLSRSTGVFGPEQGRSPMASLTVRARKGALAVVFWTEM